MTNKYPISQPEPDDESAEAMMRRPTPTFTPGGETQTVQIEALPPAQPQAPPPKPRRRLRSLFWPGFIVGFLLLSVASCGGMVLATGLNTFDLANLQSGERAWTPPQVTATPLVTLPAASDQEPIVGEAGGAFALGQQLRNVTTSQVNIRAVPGYLSKPAGDVIGQIPPNGAVEVIGGRAAADGLTWWYIRYTAPDGASIDGWIAEATASGVQILGQ